MEFSSFHARRLSLLAVGLVLLVVLYTAALSAESASLSGLGGARLVARRGPANATTTTRTNDDSDPGITLGAAPVNGSHDLVVPTLETTKHPQVWGFPSDEGNATSSTVTTAPELVNATEEDAGTIPPFSSNGENIPPYTIESMMANIKMAAYAPERVVVYDPDRDAFLVYTVAPKSDTLLMRLGDRCNRCRVILPIFIHALYSFLPNRFQPDQPPFQMLLTDADFTYIRCLYPDQDCDTSAFAATAHFGTAFKNASILPTVQLFPHPIFLACIREWSLNRTVPSCDYWKLPYRDDLSWDGLIPQIVWRGSAYPFLDKIDLKYFQQTNETSIPALRFLPREMASKLSKEATSAAKNGTLPWIDSKTVRVTIRSQAMSPTQMAAYKYQIDFGGAGGTTWKGTLEKLAMPGLLLHHETPAKDWFYDEIIPWKHYVPIRTDLSDLREKFDWAEANPEKAKEIAEQGTAFVRNFWSNRNLQRQYETYFGQNLIQFVNAYRGKVNETCSSILETYSANDVVYAQVATCTRESCFIATRHGPRSFDLRSSECYAIADINSGNRTGPIETCVD